MENNILKAACFAGGGSFGAYTVGLLSKNKPDYNVAYGCSTGSLIAPFAVLGEWELLKNVYTSVTSDKIFKVNPFYKNGIPNFFRIIKRLICKQMLGDTTNLYNMIKEVFTIEHYNKIKELNKDVCIVVTSITDKENPCKYIYLSEETYDDFCFYMWASTCVPIVCSLAIKDEMEYIDGGITDVIPLTKALTDGYKNIDVYTYDQEEESKFRSKTKNAIHLGARTYTITRDRISSLGFELLKLVYLKDKNINIKKYYPPYKLGKNALLFNKEKMNEWFNLGYNS